MFKIYHYRTPFQITQSKTCFQIINLGNVYPKNIYVLKSLLQKVYSIKLIQKNLFLKIFRINNSEVAIEIDHEEQNGHFKNYGAAGSKSQFQTQSLLLVLMIVLVYCASVSIPWASTSLLSDVDLALCFRSQNVYEKTRMKISSHRLGLKPFYNLILIHTRDRMNTKKALCSAYIMVFVTN